MAELEECDRGHLLLHKAISDDEETLLQLLKRQVAAETSFLAVKEEYEGKVCRCPGRRVETETSPRLRPNK